MKKNYWKNIFLEIRGSLSRFLAILAIVALGVGFLAGLSATAPDMRASVDRYYDETEMMDLHILSTLGIVQNDIDAVANADGVAFVMPMYKQDAMMMTQDGTAIAARVQSLPDHAESVTDGHYQNRVVITEGRMPQNEKECVVEFKSAAANLTIHVGDVLTVSNNNSDAVRNDTFAQKSMTVVGLCESAYYFSIEKETTDIGNGTINYIIYTTESAFSLPVYTDLFVTLKQAKEYMCFSDEYMDFCKSAAKDLKSVADMRSVARYNEIMAEAEKKIGDAQNEFDQKKAEAEQQLTQAADQITDGKEQYQQGKDALSDARIELLEGQVELLSAQLEYEKQRSAAQSQIDKGQTKVDIGQAALESAKSQLDLLGEVVGYAKELIADIEDGSWEDLLPEEKRARFEAWLAKLNEHFPHIGKLITAMVEEIRADISKLDAEARAKLAGFLKETFREQFDAYDQSLALYEQSKEQLAAAQLEVAAGQAQLDAASQMAEEQFAQARQKIADAKVIIEENGGQLVAAAETLTDAQEQLKAAKEEAASKLADGQSQINDAKLELDKIEQPTWYILTRETNIGYAGYLSNTEKVQSIAKIFPVFFFLVAALVALTTMTRMVDEQRTQIGTMKALGYGKGAILLKYIIYATLASVIGSAVGLTVGLLLFPTVINNAYRLLYRLPPLILGFDPVMVTVIVTAAIACTVLATLAAGMSSIRECPARLMLPRAPKIGKRILLEYIKPIWNHLSFSNKVTARNLFRYKKRFFMTVIGVAGCTALLLTGFGLQDSITDILNIQFGELWHYDVNVGIDEMTDAIKTELSDKTVYADYGEMFQNSCSVYTDNRDPEDAYFIVGVSMERMTDFITLRNRKTGQIISPTENAVVITEKLADLLGVSEGDTITIVNDKKAEADLTVSGITENYIYAYVYMSETLYTSSFHDTVKNNNVVVRLADNTQETRDKAGTALLSLDHVTSVSFTQNILDSFSDMMNSIHYIVYVLIFSAGALAFVVLYNLTNINIGERQKEIATIKVLGFKNREVAMYIFREIILLSLIGTLVGLGIGMILWKVVILNVEMDMVMFGRTVYPLSFVLAAALTMLFSLLVDFVMYFRLKHIDMVESLKSGE